MYFSKLRQRLEYEKKGKLPCTAKIGNRRRFEVRIAPIESVLAQDSRVA